jgi:hypothetical protein
MEAHNTSVSAWLGVATEARTKIKIEIKLLNETVHICSRVLAQHLGQLGHLGTEHLGARHDNVI